MYIILDKHFTLNIELVGPYGINFWASVTWQNDEIDDLDDISPDIGVCSGYYTDVRKALSDVMNRMSKWLPDHGIELSRLLNKEIKVKTFYKVTYYNRWTKSIETCVDTTYGDGPKTLSIYTDDDGNSIGYTPFEMDIIKREPITQEEALRSIARMKYHQEDAMRAFESVYGRKVGSLYELRRRVLDMPF